MMPSSNLFSPLKLGPAGVVTLRRKVDEDSTDLSVARAASRRCHHFVDVFRAGKDIGEKWNGNAYHTPV